MLIDIHAATAGDKPFWASCLGVISICCMAMGLRALFASAARAFECSERAGGGLYGSPCRFRAVDARKSENGSSAVLLATIVLEVVVLAALLIIKTSTDLVVIYAAVAGMILIFAGERLFLRSR